MQTGKREIRGTASSRRQALPVLLGACHWLPAALAAADGAPIRFAVSESLVGDVNLNDARAAMGIWIRRVAQELNIVVEFSPKMFETTEEILRRARSAQLDCIALNIIEYRQIADVLDPSQVIAQAGARGQEQYVILVKQDSGIQKLGDLKGRRLIVLKAPKMCIAPAWLFTLLEEGHHGPAEQFFGSMATDPKFSRVVLPVFFSQADACLTSRRGFETMGALNPQVARDLKTLAISPPVVVTFYVFRRNYVDVNRQRLVQAISKLRDSPAGRQLATMFQFEDLTVQDGGCLAGALGVLEAFERARGRRGAGSLKG